MKLTTEKRIWFDIPGDTDGGRVELLNLKDGDMQETINAVTYTENVYRDGRQMIRVRHKPSIARALAAAAIVDWNNHFDEQGNPLPCTPENVNRFLAEDGYLQAINTLTGQLAEMVKKEKLASEKN